MASEIFRFVNLRGSLRDPNSSDTPPPISLTRGDPTTLHTDLATAKAAGRDRAQLAGIAAKFIGSDQYALRSPLPIDISKLSNWYFGQPEDMTPDAFAAGVKQVVGVEAPSLIKSADYAETRRRLADSVLALTVDLGSNPDKSLIARNLRLCGLLESLASLPARAIDRERVRRTQIMLPADIFPLPPTANPRDAETEKAASDRAKQRAKDIASIEQLARQIADSQHAITELSGALRADTNDLRQARSQATPIPVASAAAATTTGASGRVISPPSAGPMSAGVLSAKAVGKLSTTTSKMLGNLGIAREFVDVPYAVVSLESQIAVSAAKLFGTAKSRTVTRIGDQWIPVGNSGLLQGFGDTWSTPGPCTSPAADDPGGTAPTVPATTQSQIQPIGFADLLLVRQELKRYELAEIAHVENVMKTESRRRKHREVTQTTETVTQETEVTNEESRDLETTDRYELQQESDNVVKEESSRNLALSISASYGPFASGTANISSSTGDSKETTTKNAMNYAREVVDKAVKKVQTRVLERRTVTTVHEVADISHHDFDNSKGTEHVQGIYRWLEKVYSAQVVSYGLRLLFELVVPEPAAFYRHALISAPPEGMTLELPDPPGYCHHPSGTFVPLVPSDVTPANYQFWVSKYGVSGVEPPPPLHKTIGITMAEEPADGDDFTTIMNNDLQVPTGYAAERAWVGGQPLVWADATPPAFINFHVGRTQINVNEAGPMNGEDAAIPVVAHGYRVAAMAVTIEVLCTRMPETLAGWQLSTYNAIIGAYNDLKSQYDAALSRLEINAQSGTGVLGKNPDANREVERRELKRQAISLFTNQQYDDFDAMRRGVPPYGYPQMSITEATAEGPYIQFFEQAFEWVNMSYLFYPYFWGRKSEWPAYLRQDDTDPLFAQFLQAGAARVQIPVTPGFEHAVCFLLHAGKKPWEEDDCDYQVQAPPYKSMLDEIIDEQRGAFAKGHGTIAVTQGDTTVTGTGTDFDRNLHLDRDIMINYRVYRVADVKSSTEISLDRGYQDVSASDLSYAFGGRQVGDPWEVKVPTSLVFLQPDNTLPDYTDA
jgi:hypothetical protein